MSNLEFQNYQGSIILPTGAIIPWANFSTDTPSGFLLCDSYYYAYATQTQTDYPDGTKTLLNNIYSNLYDTIGTNYGEVITTKYDNGAILYTYCFRTPNLMNEYITYTMDLYPFNIYPAIDYNSDMSYTTVGGQVATRFINKTNSVTVPLPSHNHSYSGRYAEAAQTGTVIFVQDSGDHTVYSSTSGTGSSLTLPTVPSFVMRYLIKL
jgi:hypothetical protein